MVAVSYVFVWYVEVGFGGPGDGLERSGPAG